MTDFLIKSFVTMVLLLGLYHLFLEREKMHRFNRFYLLFALAFSIALPFITFTVYKEVTDVQEVFQDEMPMPQFSVAQVEESINYTPYILLGIYLAITLVFVFRFINNLLHFKRAIAANATIKYKNAVLVLLTGKVLPHTFLHYIFINKQEYEDRLIEDELFTHELTHVTQKHTIDILFTEVLLTIFWFNPMLYFYKKAIKLNHEFLADEGVVTHTHNVVNYQKLLLQKAVPATQYHLASSLNFSVTKKRFTMMTKATPKSKALLLKLASLPVIAALIFALCTETVARPTVTNEYTNVEAVAEYEPQQQTIAKTNDRDTYYAGVKIIVLNHDRVKIVDKLYEQLTEEEKDQYLFSVPKPVQKKQLTEKQFTDYKDKSKYAIWIDGKHVENKELNNYKPEDFAYYLGSSVSKNARSKAFPQPYQFTLYTPAYFDKTLKYSHKKYGSDTYTVILGKMGPEIKTGNQDEKITGEQITAKQYAEYLEFVKKNKTTDTVRTREEFRAQLEKRKAAIMAKKAEIDKRRSAMITERDSVKDNALSLALGLKEGAESNRNKATYDAKRAEMERVKAEMDRFKAVTSQKLQSKVPVTYQEDKIYSAGMVTVQPEYPGGIPAFYNDIAKEIKTPELKETARVYVSFVIEKDGSMSNVKILREPVGLNLGAEIIIALSKTKKWLPATVENKAVRCSYNLPITFNAKK